MSDPNQNPNVNPATVTSNPNPAPAQNNPNTSRDAAEKAGMASNPQTLKAAHEPVTVGAGKQVRSSTLITNPAAPGGPDVPAVEEKPSALPQSTIDEMEAGKRALERNKPVAQALERARASDETPKA